MWPFSPSSINGSAHIRGKQLLSKMSHLDPPSSYPKMGWIPAMTSENQLMVTPTTKETIPADRATRAGAGGELEYRTNRLFIVD